MLRSTPDGASGPVHSWVAWFQLHLPILLYVWFWLGMFLCGLLAPADRVADLGSGLVQEGWHLSTMACILGIPVVVAYTFRFGWKGR